MIAFAPPDAAEEIGLVRNEAAERRARALLAQQGCDVSDERAVRQMTAEILEARRAAEQERAERAALRAAQQDYDEADGRRVWGRSTASYRHLQRAGY